MANSSPLTNPSPKQRFMEVPANIHRHREMVSSEAFERGTDAAMLQYQAAVQQHITDGNSAMAAGFKLQGALEYLQTLRMMSEVPRVIVPKISDNLQEPTR